MQAEAFLPLMTYPDANADILPRKAVRFAAAHRLRVSAMAMRVDIPAVSNVVSEMLMNAPDMIKEAQRLSMQRAQKLESLLREEADRAGVPVSIHEGRYKLPRLGEEAAGHARYCDVSLVGWRKDNPTARMLIEALIFGSGRPTVLLPEAGEDEIFDHIAIGWDGSRVAARAVSDAQALLARARTVSVVSVTGEKVFEAVHPCERLAEHLKAKGLNAEAVSSPLDGRRIGAALQETAIASGAGLLVMGGYGHSRLRDFVLGGATQGVIEDLRLPVLLAH